jgi:Phage integrase family
VIEFFGKDYPADKITGTRIDQYVAHRLKTRKPATVRLEASSLLKALRLARRAGRLAVVPDVDLPRVRNTRPGFFEEADYRRALEELKGRPDFQATLTIGYCTSWRINGLRLSGIDFERKMLRIETSKNDEGRVFPFKPWPELEQALRAQAGRAMAFQMRHGRESVSDWLFPCPHAPGQRWTRPDRPFRAAFKKAEIPARLFHHLRRSAIRNFERAGISRSVAMKLSGHKTEAVYKRYAITNEADLVEGVEKVAAMMNSAKREVK